MIKHIAIASYTRSLVYCMLVYCMWLYIGKTTEMYITLAANSHTHTLPVHCCITRLSWLVCFSRAGFNLLTMWSHDWDNGAMEDTTMHIADYFWGVKISSFSQILLYPQNFSHKNFQTFYWRNYNGIYLVKWHFLGLFSYNPQKHIREKILLSNPQKSSPSKLIHYIW